MIRLAISVEGPTEEEFSKQILTTHLRSHGLEAQPILIGRARGQGNGGGNVSVERLASEMAHLYHSFDVVTSLVDFYGFADKCDKTAEELETLVCRRIQQRVGWTENRVLPYVQMHEFEGLLFADVSAFLAIVATPRESVDSLMNIRLGFSTPEDINDNKATAPSKRPGLSHAETCFPIVGVSRVGGRFFGAREEANGCGSAATQHSERGLVGDGAGQMGARRGWAGVEEPVRIVFARR